jgi:hypothetical protein
MIKYLTIAAMIALRISYQPGMNTVKAAPVTDRSGHMAVMQIRMLQPGRLISFSANVEGSKVLLKWDISRNETADLFEVQKSTDGKNFSMAALVFGTDVTETGSYAFFEKAPEKKISYRIKVIGKDKQVNFSNVIIVKPLAS